MRDLYVPSAVKYYIGSPLFHTCNSLFHILWVLQIKGDSLNGFVCNMAAPMLQNEIWLKDNFGLFLLEPLLTKIDSYLCNRVLRFKAKQTYFHRSSAHHLLCQKLLHFW